jgi:hypothetical protein
MQYFVTGATGFIGKRLVGKLLERKGSVVHFLIRKESESKVKPPARVLGRQRGARGAGVRRPDQQEAGRAADASRRSRARSTISTTWPRSTTFGRRGKPGRGQHRGHAQHGRAGQGHRRRHFHHVSSIAAAGLYEGVFREDMFDEAENYDHPYFMTKHESEKIVRKECKVPWSVYRPAMVVGDSTTGEMDKIDGPYYFFKLIQRMRQLLPPWMPVGRPGGRAHQHRAGRLRRQCAGPHQPQGGIAKKCFHLVDPVGYRVGDVLDIFSKAAHAPKMNLFVNAALLGFIPRASPRA